MSYVNLIVVWIRSNSVIVIFSETDTELIEVMSLTLWHPQGLCLRVATSHMLCKQSNRFQFVLCPLLTSEIIHTEAHYEVNLAKYLISVQFNNALSAGSQASRWCAGCRFPFDTSLAVGSVNYFVCIFAWSNLIA
jgi:hypothetical protein